MDIRELINKKSISESSKKVYYSLLKRMEKANFKPPTKQNQKIAFVKEHLSTFDNPNTKLDMLNLIVVIRNELDLPIDKLKEFRTELKQHQKSKQVSKMQHTGENLLSLETFKEKLQKTFDEKQYKKYIVNYLMMKYGVRNKDLNLSIIKTKKEVEPKNNYLLIKKDGIKYIRDDYKTHSKYGTQTHTITDPDFIQAVKKQGVGQLLQGTQISNDLRKLYIDKHGEAKIFKMVIDYFYDNKDAESIKKIADSRGTSMGVVDGFYNVNATSNPIEEAKALA